MMVFSKMIVGAVGALSLLIGGTASTYAAPVNVELGLANSESLGAGLDIQLTVDVIGTNAIFNLTNFSISPDTSSRVHEIYFQDGLSAYFGATPSVTTTQTDVTFVTTGVSPATPPGIFDSPTTGNPWVGNLFALDETNPDKGLRSQNFAGNENDNIVITFAGITGIADSLALAAILADSDKDARFAIHVGDADVPDISAVLDSWPVPIPVPAALPLFLSGLLGLGVMARRRRKQATA